MIDFNKVNVLVFDPHHNVLTLMLVDRIAFKVDRIAYTTSITNTGLRLGKLVSETKGIFL